MALRRQKLEPTKEPGPGGLRQTVPGCLVPFLEARFVRHGGTKTQQEGAGGGAQAVPPLSYLALGQADYGTSFQHELLPHDTLEPHAPADAAAATSASLSPRSIADDHDLATGPRWSRALSQPAASILRRDKKSDSLPGQPTKGQLISSDDGLSHFSVLGVIGRKLATGEWKTRRTVSHGAIDPVRFLDLGCGDGEILMTIQAKFGLPWQDLFGVTAEDLRGFFDRDAADLQPALDASSLLRSFQATRDAYRATVAKQNGHKNRILRIGGTALKLRRVPHSG